MSTLTVKFLTVKFYNFSDKTVTSSRMYYFAPTLCDICDEFNVLWALVEALLVG